MIVHFGHYVPLNPDCSPLSAAFKYDTLGRRIEKTVDSKTTQYLYDGYDIIQEIEGGTVSENYIRILNIDEPLMRVRSDGTVRYYQTDALGSIIGLTTEDGQLSTVYSYDPFGNVSTSGETSDNPFQYTARENDGTGLYYYRERYYSPEQQRFISEDPIRLAGGINYFAYVGNKPINRSDPSGLAYFAKRRLRPFPWLRPFSYNPGSWDDINNTEISHENLFFEDGLEPSNLGYFDDNQIRPDDHLQTYYMSSWYYNDCIMRKAVNNVTPKPYGLLGLFGKIKYNCQDWAADVRREYNRLSIEKDVLRECGVSIP